MNPITKNIIEEINSYISDDMKSIENRGMNLIESSINLLVFISENFDPQVTDELTKRFINSIKNKDPDKFKRKIRTVISKPIDKIKSIDGLKNIHSIPALENENE